MLTVTPATIAINPLLIKTFAAGGGTAPYTYAVVAGGIGGTVDPTTGAYTPPLGVNGVDTIQATDALGMTGKATVTVGTPFHLLADIIQADMALTPGRVWVYDQKIKEPTDNGLFVVVGTLTDKVLSSSLRREDDGVGGLNEVKTATIVTMATIDIKSRDTSARDRRHEISLALHSTYSQKQQQANGFKIGHLPMSGPQDLSGVDGAAIPFWFQAQVRLHYSITKTASVEVYRTFQNPSVLIDQ